MDSGRDTDFTRELPREDQITSEVTYSMGQILNAHYSKARAN